MKRHNQCAAAQCLSMAAEGHVLCPHHLMAGRRARGLCANCGGRREWLPVQNELTGRQLRRNGQPVYRARCTACGREQRAARVGAL